MKRIIIGMACTSVLALSACGGSDDSASKATDSAKSAAASGASAASSAASSVTSSETTSAAAPSSSPSSSSSPDAASATSSTDASAGSASGSGAPASGSTVKVAKFATAPATVGRWKIAKTVAPTSTSAVYNDNGVGANYDVSDSLSEADARARLKTQISNIPGGFCGVGTADYALCFLKTDKGGMVTASATASNPKDNIVVTKEFAQALYAVTK